MKKFNLLSLLVNFLFITAMIVAVGCTKEGPAGKDGVDGADGADGADGTTTCVECHDGDASLSVPEFYWQSSMHNAGTALARSYNSSCSQCHSNQGFHLSNGNEPDAGVAVNDPVTINCYTCHPIHSTYTTEDVMNFTFPDQPTWIVTYGKAVDMDLGKGNLCAHCHQSRTREPVVDMNDLSAMYSGISGHYGPHYSPQANLLGGFGAYELAGSKSYGDGTHAHTSATDGCVSCHMGFTSADGNGGHNMHVSAEDDLEQSCKQCHSNGTSAEEKYVEYYHENFATIDHDGEHPTLNTTSRYTILGDMLADAGVYTKVVDSVDGYPEAVHYNINDDLEINGALTAALFNHRYLYQDHSHGIHNPGYAEALLQNSIESIASLQ